MARLRAPPLVVRVTLPVEVLIAPVRVRPPVVSLRLKAPLLALSALLSAYFTIAWVNAKFFVV